MSLSPLPTTFVEKSCREKSLPYAGEGSALAFMPEMSLVAEC
jgi:hypothetical protein